MKRKAEYFITGIAGFAGSYLAEKLVENGAKVYGLVAPKEKTSFIRPIIKNVELEKFNILNGPRLSETIKKIKPDYIIHLAAFASVGQSFDNEKLTYDINFTGTLNLLEASAYPGNKKLTKLVFVSSADVYGHFRPFDKILTESQNLNPISPYAVSKAAGEHLINYHYKKYGIPAVIIRAFNHTGPKQTDNYVIPSFCRQIAEIEAGINKPVLSVGDLSAKRDISDVRDIVNGYYLSAVKGKPGEVYQLCSGRSVTIQTILDKLLRLSHADIKVKVDKSRFRKTDIPVLRGENKKAQRVLGWKQDYKLEETLGDTLDYWRKKIKTKI